MQRVRVESIELDLSEPEHMVVVLLRDHHFTDSEFWITVVQTNLEEDILATGYGLPKDCSPEGINWF